MSARVPFEAVNAVALAAYPWLLREWFPAGRLCGHEFKVGNIAGDRGDSLKINTHTGRWSDFATGERGGDPVSLYAAKFHRGNQREAARELGRELGVCVNGTPYKHAKEPTKAEVDVWQPIMPPPPGEPPPKGLSDGFDAVYDYRGPDDRLLFYVRRREARSGQRKLFVALVYGRLNGKLGWHSRHPAAPRPLYGLNRLSTMPDAEVIVAEGEKAANAAQEHFPDRPCVSWPGGTASVHLADLTPLKGRRCVLWPDNDAAGHKAMEFLASKLPGARLVRVDDLPEGADAADVHPDDPESWLADRLGAALPEAEAETPLIRVKAGELSRMVDEAESALVRANLGLYQRGMFIVRPGIAKIVVSDDRFVLGQRIVVLGEHGLMEEMGRSAAWERFDGRSKSWIRCDPLAKVVKVYLDRKGRWQLPVLSGIINAPTLRHDGSILDQAGYDAPTGLIFDTHGTPFPRVPPSPTRDDALAALSFLKGLIGTFPFMGDADRSVALSALLTACVRRSLWTAPMHCFTAPLAGSGKTKLADLSSVLATGREAGVIAQGKSEEETEKRLGSMLLAGEAVIAIDNCEQPLGGEFLCQALTQPVVRTRILGRSEAPELPSNAFVTATGNNLTLVGDIVRRALLCRLDPRCEHPEHRRFDQDPINVAKQDRGRLVVAALTVLRAFHLSGLPQQSVPLGSFESWSRRVRDALIWLGEADPVATMEAARNSDPAREAMRTVITQWDAIIQDRRVTVRDIIEHATVSTVNGFGRTEYKHPDFREALLAIAGEGGAVNSRRLGKWLAANKDRFVMGYRIIQDGGRSGVGCWRLQAQST